MDVKMRQEVERQIIVAMIKSLLAAGYRLTVSLERAYDVKECLLGSRDLKSIMEKTFAGNDCHIFVHAADGDLVEDGVLDSIGWVNFVYDKDGWHYTTNLEPFMAAANKISKCE